MAERRRKAAGAGAPGSRCSVRNPARPDCPAAISPRPKPSPATPTWWPAPTSTRPPARSPARPKQPAGPGLSRPPQRRHRPDRIAFARRQRGTPRQHGPDARRRRRRGQDRRGRRRHRPTAATTSATATTMMTTMDTGGGGWLDDDGGPDDGDDDGPGDDGDPRGGSGPVGEPDDDGARPWRPPRRRRPRPMMTIHVPMTNQAMTAIQAAGIRAAVPGRALTMAHDNAPGGARTAAPPLPEVTVPLATLQKRAGRPGETRLLGPLDPAMTRDLAAAAARSPHSRWEVTIVDDRGYATGHGIARRGRGRRNQPQPPGSAFWLTARPDEHHRHRNPPARAGSAEGSSRAPAPRRATGSSPPEAGDRDTHPARRPGTGRAVRCRAHARLRPPVSGQPLRARRPAPPPGPGP